MTREPSISSRAGDAALSVLAGLPAFTALRPEAQASVTADATRLVVYVAAADDPALAAAALAARLGLPDAGEPSRVALSHDGLTRTLARVDFPEFIADLLKGVFSAIVESSIRQMEAYGELIADVSQSVDMFLQENDDDDDD